MSIFSIGVSGLNAAQIALRTTSNNISNVDTPGYNRELTLLSEQSPSGGVRVNDVQRQFNHFVAAQLNSVAGDAASLESQHKQISQIDNLLADLEGGLAPLMEQFFSALQDLAGAPADPAARQGVLGAADTLSAQIRSFDGYLEGLREGIDAQVKGEVAQINNTAKQLARLNEEIGLARGRSGEAPNALLNQRDQLVAELSTRVDARLHMQDGGSYTLTLGNGQPLVAGNRAFALEAVPSQTDPTRTVLAYRDAGGNSRELAENALGGGSLGGLLTFRRETLDDVQNEIGLLAASLALGFNAQHGAGLDMHGNAGGELFALGAPRVFSRADNAGGAVITAAFDNPQGLTGADYDLRVVDAATGEFAVSRRDGGGSFTATLSGNVLSFDGLSLSVDDPAALADGDRFQLQPTRRAAAELENRIKDGSLLAAGLSGKSGDNENALALLDLQNARLVRGEATFSQAYASLVSEVGNRSAIAEANLGAQRGLEEQLQLVQQSESGVNLDEEAANLIRYQQYYQANAKVIQIGATLLDTLLGLR